MTATRAGFRPGRAVSGRSGEAVGGWTGAPAGECVREGTATGGTGAPPEGRALVTACTGSLVDCTGAAGGTPAGPGPVGTVTGAPPGAETEGETGPAETDACAEGAVDAETDVLAAGVVMDTDAEGAPPVATGADMDACTPPELPALAFVDAVTPDLLGAADTVVFALTGPAGVPACTETAVLPGEVVAFACTGPTGVLTLTCTAGRCGTGNPAAATWPEDRASARAAPPGAARRTNSRGRTLIAKLASGSWDPPPRPV
jgi:hypothetical protein